MSSLAGYIPRLAGILDLTVGALYERQRALVRAGILKANEGLGPGSGVQATPDAIALLLISVLATEHLRDTAERTQAIARTKPLLTRLCPITKQPTFAKAFGSILFSYGKAEQIAKITVSRTAESAELEYYDGSGSTRNVAFVGTSSGKPGIATAAILTVELLQQIAHDAQAIIWNEGEAP